MNDIQRITNIANIVLYVLVTVAGLSFGIYYFLHKKGYLSKKKKEEKPIKNPKEFDVRKFIDMDDIKNNMIIKDNYSTFIQGVKTNGIDYPNSTPREKLQVIENYIEYCNGISNPVRMFIQATEDDIDGFLEFFDEIEKKRIKERDALIEEIRELNNTLRKVDILDKSTREMVETEIIKKEKMLENIEWIIERNRHKREFVRATTPTETYDRFESYIFTEYKHDNAAFGHELTLDEIIKKAQDELETQIKGIIRGHVACGVECIPLSSDELAQIMRTTFNPLDGDKFKIKNALKSDMFVYNATADNIETLRKKAILEEVEGSKSYAV